jgi:2-polyprenyl-6-methoxyphenol hydroxylase-like FAD-dependent oxidoreductase
MLWPPEDAVQTDADIIIVGGGLAGVTAANVLGRRWRVMLIDPRATFPSVFRAEKIEPDQAEMLRQLGVLDSLLPHARRISRIKAFYRARLFRVTPTEQYGMHYGMMVNTLRAALPQRVQFVTGRVVDIGSSDHIQRVTLDGGEQRTCRLVVLACGLSGSLMGTLRIKRFWIQRAQSIALAFSLACRDRDPVSCDAVSYALNDSVTGIDYVSFFPIEQSLRANLFAFPTGEISWQQGLIRDPNRELPRLIPRLNRALGEHKVITRVESALIDLYRTDDEWPDGMVLIGDACQNVCPSTGMGLTKIFTDVQVLCEHVPVWFSAPAMGREKLQSFVHDARKNAVDKKAIRNAYYRRNASSAQSLKWRIHRAKLHLSMQFARAA